VSWTKKIPTENGFYFAWCRHSSVKPDVVHVEVSLGGKVLYARFLDERFDDSEYFEANDYLFWDTPIEQPPAPRKEPPR